MKLYSRGFEKLDNGACAPFGEGLRAVIKTAEECGADVGQFKISWVGKNPDEEPECGEWVPEVIIKAYKYFGEED